MKRFLLKKMIFTLWVMVYVNGSAIAENSLDPEKLARVEALVVVTAEDTSPPMPKNEEERVATERMIQKRADEERERLDEIRTQPGWKPYLFELLKKHYFQNSYIDGYPSRNAFRGSR